jgi:1,4-dihydroxy-2-naphthoyl-CoA hydrolase
MRMVPRILDPRADRQIFRRAARDFRVPCHAASKLRTRKREVPVEFTSESIVRLYDTDAAGFLFYGSQFRFAHEALENFLEHLGFPVGQMIRNREALFPVVHAEADYRETLVVGDRLAVNVAVKAIGERSFTIAYRLVLADGRAAGSVVTVHAALDPATGASRPLPEAVRVALAPYLAPQA